MVSTDPISRVLLRRPKGLPKGAVAAKFTDHMVSPRAAKHTNRKDYFPETSSTFTGGSRPQGHFPRLISEGCRLFFFDDPGSDEYSFMSHNK